MSGRLSPRELALSGVLGAAALLLPVLFHLLRLGHVFLPMYLPLVTLAFLVRPLPAAATALLVPLLSAVVTGMPPLYPPVAAVMAVELAVMGALIAAVVGRWPGVKAWLLLPAALALGRVLHVAAVYGLAQVMELPAAFLAGASLLAGWPGILLMLAVVPPVVQALRRGAPGSGDG